MSKNTRRTQRGEASLSRERIIEAAIELLDGGGDGALTFRTLSERLATGAGAIYWHVANKGELMDAACNAIVTAAMDAAAQTSKGEKHPQEAIRAIGLALFDAIDAHAWVGAQLARSPASLAMLRIMEGIGSRVRALGVADTVQWSGGAALLSYTLMVAGQNAANGQYAREHGLDREQILDAMASQWEALDDAEFPFTRSIAGQLRHHDDRADFLAGIDLILAGIAASSTGKAGRANYEG